MLSTERERNAAAFTCCAAASAALRGGLLQPGRPSTGKRCIHRMGG